MVAFTTQNTRFEGSSGSRLRGVSAVAELTVSLASGSPRPTADPPRRQRPVSLYSRPARRLGEPNPHLPSGAFSSHRMAVAFVCVLGGGGVPTYRQCCFTRHCASAAHTHGANKTCFIIEIDVFLGRCRSATDRTHPLISGISGAQKRRQKDRKITDPLDSR